MNFQKYISLTNKKGEVPINLNFANNFFNSLYVLKVIMVSGFEPHTLSLKCYKTLNFITE